MVEKKDIRIIKLLSIFAFATMVLALIIILRTPATPYYEINIYNTYPWYFWMLIMLSIYAGILVLLKSYMIKAQDNYWIFGFAAILLSNFILLTIPVIQNYLILGRGDVLSHIGWMRDIVNTGYFGNDMYPITHILGAVTHYFSGISLESITTFIYPVFSIFFILSFYILYNEILRDKSKVILAMVFTSIMVFGTAQTSFSPFTLSIFIVPIFFYLYFREISNQKWNVRMLLIIATLFLLLFHPLTALLLLFSIMIIEFSRYIYLKINQSESIAHDDQPVKYRRNFSYVLIALLIAGLLLWKPYLHLLENGFYTFYYFIVSQSSPNFSSALSTANKATLQDLIKTTIYIYGVLIVTILVSLISIYELVKNNIMSLKNRSLHLLNIFMSLKVYEIFSILGFSLFILFSIFVYFKLPLFGFTRVLSFATIFTSFLIFSLFYIILESKNRKLNYNKYVKVVLISIIVLPLIFVSTFNLYDSPLTLTPNEQVTPTEVNGMEKFYIYSNNSSRTLDLGISQYRFEDYIYGEQADSFGQDIHIANLSNTSRTNPIDHFGFNNNSTTLTQFYNGSVYLLINDIAMENYPQIYPNYQDKWRFTPQDFNTLDNTQQVMLIYSNGNLKIYKTI